MRLLIGVQLLCVLGVTRRLAASPPDTNQQSAERYRNYTDYWLLQVNPSTDDQVEALQDLHSESLENSENNFQFWRSSATESDILVAPEKRSLLMNVLRNKKLRYRVKNRDVGTLINNQLFSLLRLNSQQAKPTLGDDFYQDYHTHDEIVNYARAIAAQCPSSINCQVISIGKSYEGRDIYVFKVGDDGEKPVAFTIAGAHAREWVAPMTQLYTIQQICTTYGRDKTATSLVDTYGMHFVLMMNPDGYTYSQTTDRLWRKNRAPNPASKKGCVGTDLNRNYPSHFGEVGASADQCSETYYGKGPASEPETKAVLNHFESFKDRCWAHTDLHTYSQMMLYPLGYSKDDPPTKSDLQEAAQVFVDELSKARGTKYLCGTSAQQLYKVAGGGDDHAYLSGVPYPTTIELCDKGKYGFVMPKEQILPIAKETYPALCAYFLHIANKHDFAVSSDGLQASDSSDSRRQTSQKARQARAELKKIIRRGLGEPDEPEPVPVPDQKKAPPAPKSRAAPRTTPQSSPPAQHPVQRVRVAQNAPDASLTTLVEHVTSLLGVVLGG